MVIYHNTSNKSLKFQIFRSLTFFTLALFLNLYQRSYLDCSQYYPFILDSRLGTWPPFVIQTKFSPPLHDIHLQGLCPLSSKAKLANSMTRNFLLTGTSYLQSNGALNFNKL